MADVMELKIYNKEDRLRVAAILVGNGYTVSQSKRQRTKTGKSLDYILVVREDVENANTGD